MTKPSLKAMALINAIENINPEAAKIAEDSIYENDFNDEENDMLLAYSMGISIAYGVFRMIKK